MTNFDPSQLIYPYQECGWVMDGNSYLIWRVGTGRNVEFLHQFTEEDRRRQGVGINLMRRALKELSKSPPYYSVFGFARVKPGLQEFHHALGFQTMIIPGVYRDGQCIFLFQEYRRICQHLGVSYEER